MVRQRQTLFVQNEFCATGEGPTIMNLGAYVGAALQIPHDPATGEREINPPFLMQARFKKRREGLQLTTLWGAPEELWFYPF